VFRRLAWGIIILVVGYYIIASGCAWLTFTAENNVDNGGPVIHAPRKTYFVNYVQGKGFTTGDAALLKQRKQFYEAFKVQVDQRFIIKGFSPADSPSEAGVVLKIKVSFYKKKYGQIFFVFFVLPMNLTETVDGVKIETTYGTGRAAQRRTFTGYWYDRKDFMDSLIWPMLKSIE